MQMWTQLKPKPHKRYRTKSLHPPSPVLNGALHLSESTFMYNTT